MLEATVKAPGILQVNGLRITEQGKQLIISAAELRAGWRFVTPDEKQQNKPQLGVHYWDDGRIKPWTVSEWTKDIVFIVPLGHQWKTQEEPTGPASITIRIGDQLIIAQNEDDLYNQIEAMHIFGGRR